MYTFLCRKQFNLTSGTDKIPQLACLSFSLEEADKIVATLVFRGAFGMPDSVDKMCLCGTWDEESICVFQLPFYKAEPRNTLHNLIHTITSCSKNLQGGHNSTHSYTTLQLSCYTHYSLAATLHYSLTATQHYSLAATQHYSLAATQHYSLAAITLLQL